MRNFKRSIISMLLVIVLVISSVTPVFAASEPTSYSTSRNSGKRHVVCTTLSGTRASSYYTGSYTYDRLEELSASTLLTTLRGLMKSTHKKTTAYSDCKNYADETDCENGGSNIITIYTSYSSNQNEYNSGSGWNREHVWPKSLGGFETAGAGADLHHIRPSENRTNSNRGSLKYGNVSGGKKTTGNLSGLDGGNYTGSYFEPLDNVKGDVARICLYVYVRYGGELPKCSSITNVFQSVDVLLEWCELDPVDTWEMGRNEVVAAIQGNRNVFIDYPELAWLIFGKEIPSDMVTPSGEAMKGTVGGDPSCSHTNTVLKNAKAATCTVAGYTGDTHCASCDALVSRGTAIAAPGHSFSEWTVDGEGMYRSCLVCGYVQTADKPCTHESTVIKNEKAPTCALEGYTGDTYCAECEEKLAGGESIPKTKNHDWSEMTVVTEPTFSAPGKGISTCKVCGEEQSILIFMKTSTDIFVATYETEAEKIIALISKNVLDTILLGHLDKVEG